MRENSKLFNRVSDQFLRSRIPVSEAVYRGSFTVTEGDYLPAGVAQVGSYVHIEKSRFYQVQGQGNLKDPTLLVSGQFLISWGDTRNALHLIVFSRISFFSTSQTWYFREVLYPRATYIMRSFCQKGKFCVKLRIKNANFFGFHLASLSFTSFVVSPTSPV